MSVQSWFIITRNTTKVLDLFTDSGTVPIHTSCFKECHAVYDNKTLYREALPLLGPLSIRCHVECLQLCSYCKECHAVYDNKTLYREALPLLGPLSIRCHAECLRLRSYCKEFHAVCDNETLYREALAL